MTLQPSHVSLLVALIVTAVAALYDLRSWRIPNWLSVGTLAAAPVAHFVWGAASQGLHAGLVAAGWSVAGALLCGLVPWLSWRAETFGGGDVKLLAAVGALCLPKVGIAVEFDAMIVGAVFAFGRLAWDGRLFRTLVGSLRLALNPFLPKSKQRTPAREEMTEMRLGPAIVGGVILCALFQPG
jgi:prepilin peptidase CpaA